jgi:hypothetical protein
MKIYSHNPLKCEGESFHIVLFPLFEISKAKCYYVEQNVQTIEKPLLGFTQPIREISSRKIIERVKRDWCVKIKASPSSIS